MGFMVGVKVRGSLWGSVYWDCAAATAALVTPHHTHTHTHKHIHTHLLTNMRMRQPLPLLFYKCPCLLQSALQPLIGFWPAQLSLSLLSKKVFTECCCQQHVKPPTWRTCKCPCVSAYLEGQQYSLTYCLYTVMGLHIQLSPTHMHTFPVK